MSHRTTTLAQLTPQSRPERIALGVFSVLVATCMVGFAVVCSGLNILAMFLTHPLLTVFGALLAAGPGAFYLAFILWLDRNEPEPPWLVAAALTWGGVTATGVSLLFNTLFGAMALSAVGDEAAAQQITASISAPLFEESSKGFALVLLYLLFRKQFDSLLDGLIYGALIGLGFAVVENWFYYVNTGSVGGAIGLTWVRGLVTGAGTHMCFTAMAGAGVGMFRVMRGGLVRWLLPPLGLAVGMGAHFAWNTFAGLIAGMVSANGLLQMLCGLPVAVVVLQVPFLVMAFTMVGVASVHEKRVMRVYLADERAPVIREGELAQLLDRRFRHLLVVLFTEGVAAWWAQRGRFARLVRLAFEKWHMEQEADAASSDARDHAVRVRDLRAELSA